jgi:hypothetical protein
VPDSTLVGGDVVLVLGTNFKGIAASSKAAPVPALATISPEEACDQAS